MQWSRSIFYADLHKNTKAEKFMVINFLGTMERIRLVQEVGIISSYYKKLVQKLLQEAALDRSINLSSEPCVEILNANLIIGSTFSLIDAHLSLWHNYVFCLHIIILMALYNYTIYMNASKGDYKECQ